MAIGLCSADYDDGFPDVIKRAAFEEIIGNYYAFDPFLQSGRKGRELENSDHDFNKFSSFEQPPPNTNLQEDPTLYSIPPALTHSEGKDLVEFETDSSPVFIARPPVNRDVIKIDEFQSKRSFKKEQQQQRQQQQQQEFENFPREDYPQYPPFLTEESVREQKQLLPVGTTTTTTERILPNYVIGVAEEERTDEGNFFNLKPRVLRGSRQTIYRDDLPRPRDRQFVRRVRPVQHLDDSPFARRSSRLVNFDQVPMRRRTDNHNRPSSYVPNSRNLRNGYYSTATQVYPQ